MLANLVRVSLLLVPLVVGAPPELAVSNANTPAGALTTLHARTTYSASSFPIPLRITAPDATWSGSQWKTTTRGKPAFGWIAIGHVPPGASAAAPPLGAFLVETEFGPTPSVAAILTRLRSAGGGANFGPTKRVTLAGFAAWQIDGNVYGRFGHTFVPFSPRTGGASPADAFRLDPGEAFRITVLDVRGKRVVVAVSSVALPAGRFATFLPAANRILATLRFPP
jgi:hypothetical protein